MNKMKYLIVVVVLCSFGAYPALAQDDGMSFFITSTNPGAGADLGGLAGADQHCQMLAQAAGAGGKTWRAYLSTSGAGGVNARDRIGEGPWSNHNGDVVAMSVDDLHYNNGNFTKATILTENGDQVNGVGDQPNRHDVLTGSNPDGTASEMTCENWTNSGEGSTALVGHHDRRGRGAMGASWNNAHPSRGCSMELLQASGGAGFFYCFAID